MNPYVAVTRKRPWSSGVTSNRSSMAEVAGGAALLVDPEDEWAIADAIARLLEDDDLRSRLGEEGRRRTSALTWRNTARATWNVYRELYQDEVRPLSARGAHG